MAAGSWSLTRLVKYRNRVLSPLAFAATNQARTAPPSSRPRKCNRPRFLLMQRNWRPAPQLRGRRLGFVDPSLKWATCASVRRDRVLLDRSALLRRASRRLPPPRRPADRLHGVVDDRLDLGARDAGAGADRQRMDGRRGHQRQAPRVGVGGKLARGARGLEQALEGAIHVVDRLADDLADLRIGDSVGGGAEHREAAARTLLAAEIEIERRKKNAPQLVAQRSPFREQRRERLAHMLAIAAIGLGVERALVAEGAVQARAVEPCRRTQVVERGRGETVLPEGVHGARQGRLGLERARTAWPARRHVGGRV